LFSCIRCSARCRICKQTTAANVKIYSRILHGLSRRVFTAKDSIYTRSQ
jgi:hypothetical protein